MRILLIIGGWSEEREVSLAGGKAIHTELLRMGHEVEVFDPLESFVDLPKAAARNDFAFINLHGLPGEDGLIQAVLERYKLPYGGSGPAASLLCLDKVASKLIFREVGLFTPDFLLLPRQLLLQESERSLEKYCQPKFPPPYFVKPNRGGSSCNTAKITETENLLPAVKQILSGGDDALVESCIEGTEITCPVLGEKPLPPVLIIPPDGADFFDYHSKYSLDGAEEICPAPLSEEILNIVKEAALLAHQSLGLYALSRADFILPESSPRTPYILEVNSLPGMTETSLLPKSARAAGMKFGDLLEQIMEFGLKRYS